MQSYMSPKEVANSLLNEAKIEPEFTELGNAVSFFCFLSPFVSSLLGLRLFMYYATVSNLIEISVDIFVIFI